MPMFMQWLCGEKREEIQCSQSDVCLPSTDSILLFAGLSPFPLALFCDSLLTVSVLLNRVFSAVRSPTERWSHGVRRWFTVPNSEHTVWCTVGPYSPSWMTLFEFTAILFRMLCFLLELPLSSVSSSFLPPLATWGAFQSVCVRVLFSRKEALLWTQNEKRGKRKWKMRVSEWRLHYVECLFLLRFSQPTLSLTLSFSDSLDCKWKGAAKVNPVQERKDASLGCFSSPFPPELHSVVESWSVRKEGRNEAGWKKERRGKERERDKSDGRRRRRRGSPWRR